MELNAAVRRILVRHVLLIVVAILLGVVAGFAVHSGDSRTFTASARLSLGTDVPADAEEAIAIADTAAAIVTSPDRVQSALSQAGARRDMPEFAQRSVGVRPIGSSGVLDLSVTDMDPRVAATVANRLAADLIRTTLDATQGSVEQVETDLRTQIDGVETKIGRSSHRIARVDAAIALAAGGPEATVLDAQRRSVVEKQQALLQQRFDIRSQLNDLLATDAMRLRPRMVDPASVPLRADPSRRGADIALGALLGLLGGLGLAALIETLRPMVDGDSVARELEVPLLGRLPTLPSDTEQDQAATEHLAARVSLAAWGADVRTIELLAAEPTADLRALVGGLETVLRRAEARGQRRRSRGESDPLAERQAIVVRSFDPLGDSVNGGANHAGLVGVFPSVMKRTELRSMADLLAMTHRPVLGVVTYDRTRVSPIALQRWRRGPHAREVSERAYVSASSELVGPGAVVETADPRSPSP